MRRIGVRCLIGCWWALPEGNEAVYQEAIGEVGRCPRERPGPGPDAARIANVAIGEEATESKVVGARRDPESVEAEAVSQATEVEFPFAAVDLVIGIIVM